MKTEDQILIKKILKGRAAAADKLYYKHEVYWYRLCSRYARNREETDDIFQEGVSTVFKQLSKYDQKRNSFKAWSNKVIIHAALAWLKKNQWQQSFEDIGLVERDLVVAEDALGQLTVKELINLIQRLPSGYRVVFNLYEIEGYTHKEIAEMLNISVGTSKSQLSKAKRLLRRHLELLF